MYIQAVHIGLLLSTGETMQKPSLHPNWCQSGSGHLCFRRRKIFFSTGLIVDVQSWKQTEIISHFFEFPDINCRRKAWRFRDFTIVALFGRTIQSKNKTQLNIVLQEGTYFRAKCPRISSGLCTVGWVLGIWAITTNTANIPTTFLRKADNRSKDNH